MQATVIRLQGALFLALLASAGFVSRCTAQAGASTSARSPASRLATSSTVSPRFFGLTVLDYQHHQAELPYSITRSWDAYPGVSWPEINPARARYDFARLDQFLAQAGRHGREIIYTFGRTPRWASTRPEVAGAYTPGECAAPDLATWDAFVEAIVRHAAGRVLYWELWNEPDQGRFYCGDIPTMVTLAQHAAGIIRRLQPAAIILSPAGSNGDAAGWLAKFIVAGGRDTFDAVAFHGYEGARAEAILPIVAVFRHALQATNTPDRPLIDTECSWGENPIGDNAHQAAFLAKYLILQASAKVSRALWYAYDAEPKWGRLIDDRGQLLPVGIAYRETEAWLTGATFSKPCEQDAQGTWTCPITRLGGYRGLIVWNSTAPHPVDVTAPAEMTRTRDLAGKRASVLKAVVQAGNLPVLVETATAP